MIIYSTTPQGSDEWLAQRAGLLTASVASTMMSKEGSKGLLDLIDNLAMERVYGYDTTVDSYKSGAMQRGNDLEPEARSAFEFIVGDTSAEVGLATNSAYPGAGASLDGLIGDSVGLEIKCTCYKTLRKYAREDRLPLAYRHQVVFQQMICDLDVTHFWAYHPLALPFHIMIRRDEKAIEEMAERYREINTRIELEADKEKQRGI